MDKIFNKKINLYLYPLFFFIIFFTQFSYIDQEVIDWDESTFFVISKYLSQGDLLYVDYWDGKPPIIFLYLAILFKFFGSSLLVGRLAGDFLILLNVIFIFKILDNEFNKLVASCSTFFLIYLFSYNASQPTMTEHLGILFIVACYYQIIISDKSLNHYLLGILFSLAFNSRNNLAFACLGIIIFLFFEKKITFKNIFKIGIGFIAPIFLIGLYFLSKNSIENYIYMLLKFPLQVSSYRMSFNEIKNGIFSKLNLNQSFSFELIISICLIVIFLYLFTSFSYKEIPDLIKLSIIIFISLLLSIIAGGRLFNHYLIQLFPFVTIIFGYGLNLLQKRKALTYIIVLIFLLLNFNLTEKGLRNLLNYENIQLNYPIKNISKTIDNLNLKNKEFLVLENHIIYLYTDKITPFKIVHPSNLPNTSRYNSLLISLSNLDITYENEFNRFVQRKPHYIFCELECDLYIDQKFYDDNYILLIESSGLKLYQRNQ